MCSTFNENFCMTIVFCDSSSDVGDKMRFSTFYNELSSLVRFILYANVLIIDRDTNGQITQDRNNKFSLHNSRYRKVEYLADFSLGNRLANLNINFHTRKPCTTPNKNVQTDYAYLYKRSEQIALWTVMHISLLKENLLIIESYQRFAWVYAEIRNKRRKFHYMTGRHQ